MSVWRVDYSATYFVEAETEDEAIDLAIEEHGENPDGIWEAVDYVTNAE